MPFEDQAPDALIADSNHSACVLSDLTSDPDSGDGNWCVASGNNTDTEIHCSFDTPTDNPTIGADLQTFKVEVRQFDGGQSGTPDVRIELWENGSLVRAGSAIPVTSASSQTVSFTFNANELGTADGSLVEIKVIGLRSGGGPTARNTIDTGGIQWEVEFSVAAQDVSPSGIISAEVIGAAVITSVADISPASITSAEAFGTAVLTLELLPTSITSAEVVNSPVVTSVADISPTGIVSAESVSSPTVVMDVFITVPSIVSAEVVPSPAVLSVYDLSPSAIASAETFGSIALSFDQDISPAGIASEESLGSAAVFFPATAPEVGDIGIWVDQDGGLIPTGSFTKVPFEGSGSQVRNDGGYTYNTSTDDITVPTAGNYLVLYHLLVSDTSTNRGSYVGQVTLNGTVVEGSQNSGYKRTTAGPNISARGSAIVAVAADDEIAIEWLAAGAVTSSVAGSSNIMIVRLPDDADSAVGHYEFTSGQILGGATFADIGIAATVRETDTSVIERTGTDIALKKNNTTYLISYGVNGSLSGGLRTSRVGRFVADSTPIEQSYASEWGRNGTFKFACPAGMFLYRTGGSTVNLSAQMCREVGTHAWAAPADNLWTTDTDGGFSVMELPSFVETLIAHDGTAAQTISGGVSVDVTSINIVDQNDAVAFTKVNSTTVNCEKAMDVLLMASVMANRTAASTVRTNFGGRFELQGSNEILSETYSEVRGDTGADIPNGCVNPTWIGAVNSGDDIQLETFDAGADGANDETLADAVGFCALNLDSFSTTTPAQDLGITGIASLEAFGTLEVVLLLQEVIASSISSAEAFGSALVTPGAVDVNIIGISSAEVVSSSLSITSVANVSVASISSSEAFGSTAVLPGAVLVTVDGITSAESFGSTLVTPGTVDLSVIGIPSEEVVSLQAIDTFSTTHRTKVFQLRSRR